MVEQALLIPHPATMQRPFDAISCGIVFTSAGQWSIEYAVPAPASMLRLPPTVEPARADDLWQRTCFEMFLLDASTGAYLEFNFSPSGEWASYRFDGYRAGMQNAAAGPVHVKTQLGSSASETETFNLSACLDDPSLAFGTQWRMGLSAIIESNDGSKSYWALRHPPGKPDFHHRDCFALELAAPDEA